MITLKAPYVGPTKIITVKNPELSDSDSYGLNISPLKFMDGSIKTYINTPTVRKFVWHFTQLSLSKWIEFKDFLLFAQGKDILLTDYNLIDHKARVLNNILDFKFSGRGSGKTTITQEAVDIDLEFEILS